MDRPALDDPLALLADVLQLVVLYHVRAQVIGPAEAAAAQRTLVRTRHLTHNSPSLIYLFYIEQLS